MIEPAAVPACTSPTQIVVTGLGAVTPAGHDQELVHVTALAATPPPPLGSADRAARMDRVTRLASAAAQEAMADAGLKPGDVPGDRLAVSVATGLGGLASAFNAHDQYLHGGSAAVAPLTVGRLMLNGPAAQLSVDLGARAGAHSPASACASGAEAIAAGIEMIRAGRADVVIAGGADAPLHPMILAAFAATGALSPARDPQLACLPFDPRRNGFVMGEGAAVLILESAAHATARSRSWYATAAGAGYSADGYDLMRPAPGGEGAQAAMRRALTADQISHLSAHGTGTRAGDAAEAAAIEAVFGDRLPAITATKASTDHLLGASGALEAAVTVLALTTHLVPPTALPTGDHARGLLPLVTGAPHLLRPGPAAAISNAFGFGGHNLSLILLRLRVYPFRRDGAFLVTIFDVTNVGATDYHELFQEHYVDDSDAPGDHFRAFAALDPATGAAYRTVRVGPQDHALGYLASPLWIRSPNMPNRVYMYLSAPPDNRKTLTLDAGPFGKISGVPAS
jgi:3-oxoacyl-[acyl-carrier-protein] synthase II